ncbi:unnamed protein product [Caenorhabditis auriculariae]|uniref:RZZ complex subunit KNTC1/ROD C-terminal domain-containing protein n=1 Tax=Caenorhabditis auriculariae TaxID=2777116 RepID=A0A8S1GYX7_9PELO|nr:unnamed protein product [Caenorhabditis auriculariae]
MRLGPVDLEVDQDYLENVTSKDIGLYEVKNVAVIRTKDDLDLENFHKEKLLCVSNEQFITLASGPDLAIFSSSQEIEYRSSLCMNGCISSIALVGNSAFLVVCYSGSSIDVISLTNEEIVFRKDLPILAKCISSRVVADGCFVLIGDDRGNFVEWKFPTEVALSDNRFEKLETQLCTAFFNECTQNHNERHFSTNSVLKETFSCGSGPVSAICALPSNSPGLIFSDVLNSEFFLFSEDIQWKCVRNSGRFIFGLSEDGFLHVFDTAVLCFINRYDLKEKKDDIVINFAFVNQGEAERPNLCSFVVQNGTFVQTKIYNIETHECIFSTASSSEAHILAANDNYRVMVTVEPRDAEVAADSEIVVRQVCESQPEVKLDSLLKRYKFDEAEQFAKTYKLDLQRVYVSRVNYLVSDADLDQFEESYQDLMRTFDLVADHNTIGETCISLISLSQKFERIMSYLTYAKKRKITDLDTLNHLDDAAYILATYRLITGPDLGIEGIADSWFLFIEALHGEQPWPELFSFLLQNAAVSEARVIWQRHGTELKSELISEEPDELVLERIDALFEVLQSAVNITVECWKDVIEFFAVDLLPGCLKMSAELIPRIEKMLVYLIGLLEHRDASNFPQNGIHVAATFERLARQFKDDAVTPVQQSELAFFGRYLCVDDSTGRSPLSRMKNISMNLKNIQRLREVYMCTLSYSTYTMLKTDEICHQILQLALDNPSTIQERMEKYVKPYMEEHSLKQDETIFNYIEGLSQVAMTGTSAPIKGWEEPCVQLCASLRDTEYRCKAVICIASASKVPWPRSLNESVKAILNSRSLPRETIKTMEKVCHRVEIIKLLANYSYDRSFLTSLCKGFEKLSTLVRCVLAQQSQATRSADAVKLVELFELVVDAEDMKSLEIPFVKSLIVIQMIKDDAPIREVATVIEETGAEQKEKVFRLVLNFIESVADSVIDFDNAENVEERERILTFGEVLISYFARNRVEDEDYKSSRQQLQTLRRVQKESGRCVSLSDLRSSSWQRDHVRRLVTKNIPMKEFISKCTDLGIEYSQALTLILSKYVNEMNILGVVDAISDYVSSARMSFVTVNPELFEVLIDSLAWILSQLPNVSDDAIDADKADNIFYVISSLSNVMPTVVEICDVEAVGVQTTQFLLQMEGYLNLFRNVIKQSLRGKTDEVREEDSSQQRSQEVSDPDTTEEYRINVFARRLGVYDICNESALFEGVEGILLMAGLAPSVARTFERSLSEDKSDLMSEYRNNWESFFMFLSVHSQDLLEISARVFASTLPCWNGVYQETCVDLSTTVQNVVERMMQMHPFDSWHVVSLLSAFPFKSLHQKLLSLRNWVSHRKSPQTYLNYLQISFFFSLLTDVRDLDEMMTSAYQQKWWTKTMNKNGLNLSIAPNMDFEALLAQASDLSTPLSPDLLHLFLKSYGEKARGKHRLSTSEYMVRFAMMMVRKASNVSSSHSPQQRLEIVHRYLMYAEESLRIGKAEECETAFAHLSGTFYLLCPYNYEVIDFLISKMEHYPDQEEFCRNCRSLLRCLWQYKRTNHISRDEYVWYTERLQKIAQEEKEIPTVKTLTDPLGSVMKRRYEEEAETKEETMPSDEAPAPLVFKKDEFVIPELPPLSFQRIPFHVFLYRKKVDVETIILPIITSELSIYNVIIWQHVVRQISWLSQLISRSHLLSTAIYTHATVTAAKERTLREDEKVAIGTLLSSGKNRNIVVPTISLLFRKIPLSDAKVQLLRMGADLAENWIENGNPENPLSETERVSLADQCTRLRDGIAKFFTMLALKKSQIYNEKTSDRLDNPEDLCTVIYEEMVDWENSADVDAKTRLVESIADESGVNLQILHERLLMQWVESAELSSHESQIHVDLNDTMGEALPAANSQTDVELVHLPLFDKHITRIVSISRNMEKARLIKQLMPFLVRGGANVSGGYAAVVRACCVLLRVCSEEDLAIANGNHENICAIIEQQQYLSMLVSSNVDMSIETFVKMEKLNVLKSLLQAPARNPLVSSVIAALIVDHEYKDSKNIEQVMARLQACKQWRILKVLLEYTKRQSLYKSVRSFSLLWFRVYERIITDLESVKTDASEIGVQMRKMTFWLMGCCTEGGRQAPIGRYLRSRGCPVSASVVSILSSYTIPEMDALDLDKSDEQSDLSFLWSKTLKNGYQSEVSMEA